jgi:hypothetical protein
MANGPSPEEMEYAKQLLDRMASGGQDSGAALQQTLDANTREQDFQRFMADYGEANPTLDELRRQQAVELRRQQEQERLARRVPPGFLEQGLNVVSQAMGYAPQYGYRDPSDPTMMDYARDSLNLLTGYPTQYIGRGQRSPSAPATPEDPGFDYSAPTDEDLQNFMENYGAANQIQEQEKQDQLSLADIRAMLGFKGGTPRGIGVRDFSKQRQQILDDYKEQYAAGQKYEAERRKAAEAEVAKSRQRFEEASDLQGKFKFDPTRVLDSTGDIIAAAIFVGLSGAANAMAGQPGAKNQALEIINGTIDRDIQAQKMEYQQLKDRTNTSENLYARNMQLLQNERLAENLTKQQMLEFADGQAKISLKNVAANEAAAQFRANLNASLEKARLDTAEAMFKYQSDAGKKGSLTYTQQRGLQASIKQNFDASETFQVAEDALKVIAGGLADFSNDVNSVDRLIGNLTQIYQSKLAGEGDEPTGMIAESLGALSGIVSDKFAASQQLNSIIKQMAFSLASRSQSASSISNKDVQMFADLLRDKQADPRRVGLFFQHLRTKAELSAIADKLILDGAEVRNADQMALQQYLSIPGKNNMVIGTSEFGTPVTPYMAEYVDAYQTPVSSGLASYEVE